MGCQPTRRDSLWSNAPLHYFSMYTLEGARLMPQPARHGRDRVRLSFGTKNECQDSLEGPSCSLFATYGFPSATRITKRFDLIWLEKTCRTQAHAKQQRRQILARQEDTGRENEGAASDVGASNATTHALSASLTDGEEAPISLSRQRQVLRCVDERTFSGQGRQTPNIALNLAVCRATYSEAYAH